MGRRVALAGTESTDEQDGGVGSGRREMGEV